MRHMIAMSLLWVIGIPLVACGGLPAGGLSTDAAPESPDEYLTRLGDTRYFELNRYRFIKSHEKPLGRGVFGVVFRAMKLPEGTPVALKCAYPGDARTPGRMLAEEVSIMKSLRDFPWTLHLIDYRSSPPAFECAVSERGGRPVEYLVQRRSLTVCETLNVAARMLYILNQLHAAGFAHGDAHWGNWLMDDPSDLSTLKLIDFGMAKPILPDSPPPGEVILDSDQVQHEVWRVVEPFRDSNGPCSSEPFMEEPNFDSISALVPRVRAALLCAATRDDASPIPHTNIPDVVRVDRNLRALPSDPHPATMQESYHYMAISSYFL